MEQVLPGSEGAMQEQYPNGWPKITARQERIKLGLPAEMPPSPRSKEWSRRRPLVVAALSAVVVRTGAVVGAAATGKRWRLNAAKGQVGKLKGQVADL